MLRLPLRTLVPTVYTLLTLEDLGRTQCMSGSRFEVQRHLCKDSLSVHYLADRLDNTVFLMYLHLPARGRIVRSLIGCAVVLPMSGAVLNLKCLCANKDVWYAKKHKRY